MTYSESKSESDFIFAINSESDFHSASESGSDSKFESDFTSAFMNLEICFFLLFYICILLNKPVDGFLAYSHDGVNSYASN